jgi:hypothetical protein
VNTDPAEAKPASLEDVITDSGGESAPATEAKPDSQPGRSPSSSACIPYQEVIELGLSRGRNAMAIWQELVDTCGFASGYQSVRRFVSRLQGGQSSEPCAVIETGPGEEAQVDYGDGPTNSLVASKVIKATPRGPERVDLSNDQGEHAVLAPPKPQPEPCEPYSREA